MLSSMKLTQQKLGPDSAESNYLCLPLVLEMKHSCCPEADALAGFGASSPLHWLTHIWLPFQVWGWFFLFALSQMQVTEHCEGSRGDPSVALLLSKEVSSKEELSSEK